MKKTNFPAFISTFIILYIFWLAITGQIVSIFTGDAAVQTLIAGVIVCALASLFTARFFIHEKAFYMYNPAKFLVAIFYGVIIFGWELIKANWDVAKRALSPKLPVNPGIVKVPVNLKSEYGLSALANSITLTPGTITMDVADEGKQTYFYIHWIDVATADPVEAGDAIKGTLEKWIGRIWK